MIDISFDGVWHSDLAIPEFDLNFHSIPLCFGHQRHVSDLETNHSDTPPRRLLSESGFL